MKSDTAREAVARAICAADNHGWPDDTYDGRFSRRAFERQADSAISAFTAWLQENAAEAMARAIWEDTNSGDGRGGWELGCSDFDKEVYRSNARAAIRAIAAPKLESDQ